MSYGRTSQREICTAVRKACIEGEQIVLREQSQLDAALEALRFAKEPMSTFHSAWPGKRPSVMVAQPGEEYSYVPLAVNYKYASRLRKNDPESGAHLWLNRTASAAGVAPYSTDAVALIFFSTFPSSFAEVFSRSVPRVLQAERAIARQRPDSRLHLVPALWRPQLHWLLAPFGEGIVRPLGALAQNFSGQEVRGMYNARPSVDGWRAYIAQQEEVAQQPARCYEHAYICDFHANPGKGLVLGTKFVQASYETAQRLARHLKPGWAHASPSPRRRVVVFARRDGRRRLSNLDELLASCAAEGPTLGVAEFGGLACESHNFRSGFRGAADVLSRADVFVSPHGGDMTNGLFLRPGAAVIEVLPLWGGGSKDRSGKYRADGAKAFGEFFQLLYHLQPVCNQQLFTLNRSRSHARSMAHAHTWNEDLILPWEALRPHLLDPPKPTLPPAPKRGAELAGCPNRAAIEF